VRTPGGGLLFSKSSPLALISTIHPASASAANRLRVSGLIQFRPNPGGTFNLTRAADADEMIKMINARKGF
jgi:hypothetical protein